MCLSMEIAIMWGNEMLKIAMERWREWSGGTVASVGGGTFGSRISLSIFLAKVNFSLKLNSWREIWLQALLLWVEQVLLADCRCKLYFCRGTQCLLLCRMGIQGQHSPTPSGTIIYSLEKHLAPVRPSHVKLAILIWATKGGPDLPTRYLHFVHCDNMCEFEPS